nr:MAG TPA: DNA polymerase B [Caudoviricetes sp.]
MKKRTFIRIAADFETTTYKGQTDTEVWAAAFTTIGSEKVTICNSIELFFSSIREYVGNLQIYFHNLKFDGHFILDYFIRNYSQAIENNEFLPEKRMRNGSFKYLISDMGQWYYIIWKIDGRIIEFRDSYKLLPFSLKKLGKDFKTKHQKTSLEYKGIRKSGDSIKEDEADYIRNDVLVLSEALNIFFSQGHTGLTIGSCCLSEFKQTIGNDRIYSMLFPDLREYNIGEETVESFIRKAYRGGWCYLNPRYSKSELGCGTTYDVNSLYPYVMLAESGNYYPYGLPYVWTGNTIPDKALDKFYYVRIRASFDLKPNMLPFVQIKHNPVYRGNEMLITSRVKGSDGRYYSYYNIKGTDEIKIAEVELTFCKPEFELFLKHYDANYTIIAGCYFDQTTGIFDEYLTKYRHIKENSEGAIRATAKLFSNNLYGKMAASDFSSYKICEMDKDVLAFHTIEAHEKTPGYIPIGAAITAYARRHTIRAAQANFLRFVYADTDSIHCIGEPEDVVGVEKHVSKYGAFKLESTWDVGYFARQKTYIEGKYDGDILRYDIKCAGMPQHSKDLLAWSLGGLTEDEKQAIKLENDAERIFVSTPRQLTDFDVGLVVPGKLIPKRLPGGIVLEDTFFEMRATI